MVQIQTKGHQLVMPGLEGRPDHICEIYCEENAPLASRLILATMTVGLFWFRLDCSILAASCDLRDFSEVPEEAALAQPDLLLSALLILANSQ